ncbi:methyl-accepting chemotaxis protein [Marinobacterium mangrovicola]|uniref:Methyl-accepting chemotaxis protein n=1 Tax=Marinobacterium mangrovicola TaxID=1476959 RepID=A0A4R1GLE8_9GAMM|nr:methyl-accepting chemotaxis protein [Marinobacterium mangrovicola]TCK06919.1 methyl-accepting chemotaxis protein [Marinobacterium mangrovicola]
MNIRSIRVKSSIPSVLLAATILISLVLSSGLLQLQQRGFEHQTNSFMPAISTVLNADRDLYQAREAELQQIYGQGDMDKLEADRQENADQVKERFQTYREYMSEYPAVVDSFKGFDRAFSDWLAASDRVVASAGASRSELDAAEKKASEAFSHLRSILDKAGEAAQTAAVSEQESIEKEVESAQLLSEIIIAVAILIALFVSYIVPKRLARQTSDLTASVREIAEGDGDLTARVDARSHDELGDLGREFNHFLDKLQTLVGSIMNQSNEFGRLLETLSESSDRTREITGSLGNASNSIVSAVHEMSLANKEMATVANGTAQEAESSTELVEQGETVLERTNSRIAELASEMEQARARSDELEKESNEIASVVDVIGDIAEQTNLLALNAAIEAARAGEQGRGFAVVADEVRVLATRTQESTGRIQGMIERLQKSVVQSVKVIDAGKASADDSMVSLGELNQMFASLRESFTRVSDLSVQTAQATEEQSAVSDEIGQNLSSLNDQTASAAEVAEANEALASDINRLSQQLSQLVGRFKV